MCMFLVVFVYGPAPSYLLLLIVLSCLCVLFTSCFVLFSWDGQNAREVGRLGAHVGIIFLWRFGRLTSLYCLDSALSFQRCVIVFPHVLCAFFLLSTTTLSSQRNLQTTLHQRSLRTKMKRWCSFHPILENGVIVQQQTR